MSLFASLCSRLSVRAAAPPSARRLRRKIRRARVFLLNALLLLIPLCAGAWLLSVQPVHADYDPIGCHGCGFPGMGNPGTTGGSGTGYPGNNSGYPGNNSGYPGNNNGTGTGYPGSTGGGTGTGYPGSTGGNNTGYPGGGTNGTGYPGSTGGSNTGYPGSTGGNNSGSSTGYPGGGTNGSGSGTGYPGGNTGGTGSGNTGGTSTGGSGTGYPGGGTGTGYPGSGTGTGTGGTGTGTGGGTITPGHWDVSYSSKSATTSWDYVGYDANYKSTAKPDSRQWPATASGDGVYGDSYLDADTKGTVTATLTWVPTTGQDSTSDPPSSSVIVTEYGSASASGGGPGTGSADDGWGDTSSQGGYPGSSSGGGGYPGSASSSGTHYEVKDGSSGSITITKTLSASTPKNTTPDANGNFAAVGAMVSVGLSVAGVNTTVTLTGPNAANQALTGQGVKASLNGAPANVSSYTWSFPSGTPIKTWDPFGKAADGTPQQLFPFTDADKTRTDTTGNGISVPDLIFYDQTAESVTVKCVVNYMLPKDGNGNAKSGTLTVTSKSVNFLKPKVTKWDITGGWVQHYNSTTWGLAVDPNSPAADGMTWSNVTISVPTPFSGGQGCFAQIVTPDHEVFQDGATNPITGPNNKKAGLDSGFPYGPATGFWTVPAPGSDVDGPGITSRANLSGYEGYTKIYANDAFTTYVLYKPPSSGSGGPIWVPLSKYDWNFSVTVLWQNNMWVTTQAFPSDAASVPTYKFNDAKDPPKWSLVQSNY